MKHQRDKPSIMYLANENCMRYFEVYIIRTGGNIT